MGSLYLNIGMKKIKNIFTNHLPIIVIECDKNLGGKLQSHDKQVISFYTLIKDSELGDNSLHCIPQDLLDL